MAAFHQAEHLAGIAAHLQRLAVELAFERIEGVHDVADGAVAVSVGVRGGRLFGLVPHAGLVSLTICSQKSTPTRLSWKIL